MDGDSSKLVPLLPTLPPMNARKCIAEEPGQANRMASLEKIITIHMRKCNAEGCNGPCNHASYSYDDASDSSDDLSLSSSDNLSGSCTSSIDLDQWDVDELDDGIDDEDYLMEPASNSASKYVSKSVLEENIAKLKQQCIKRINDKLPHSWPVYVTPSLRE